MLAMIVLYTFLGVLAICGLLSIYRSVTKLEKENEKLRETNARYIVDKNKLMLELEREKQKKEIYAKAVDIWQNKATEQGER